ncbi:sensor histidine kinase [Virgibacillus sp. LDC-1]|uniref:sensor histidine kinase n=1 Tax=Virgibacillus sp. LDC-1 TaxID=3039856 RepID=UPI0024DEEE2D|nr:sensor histidine kinase [Virgibacillus sp. LDC-1]
MTIFIRHVFTSVFFSLLLILLVFGVLATVFPTDNWQFLLDKTIADVPILYIIIGIPIVAGTVFGVSIGWYWRQRTLRIARQLDELAKGQPVSRPGEQDGQLKKIDQALERVEEKLRNQTEQAQRQATIDAVEREKSLQEIVVQERNRLARELHDSVSQQLFAASMMMSTINEMNAPIEPTMQRQLHLIEKAIHQSQSEMRALLLHLRPVPLKGKSIQEGIEELLQELSQKVPMSIHWQIEDMEIAKGIEDQLFRILQEAISNTLRHANATKLEVLFIERDGMVIMRSVDNGVGFDLKKVKTSSYGLNNMHERALQVGGMLKVISLPDEGTRLEVKIPIQKKGE